MLKVLVIDDDAQAIQAISRHLADSSYRIFSADEGQEALELSGAERPNVILLAVGSPRISAAAVCRSLRLDERTARIPIVVFGDSDMREVLEECLDAGADDYFLSTSAESASQRVSLASARGGMKPPCKALSSRDGDALAMRIRLAARAAARHDELAGIGRQWQQEMCNRERAEREAASLRWRMEVILGATKAGFVIVDSHLRLSYVDRGWRAACGDPGLKKCCRYLGCGSGGCSSCAIRKAMATGKAAVSEHNLPSEDNRRVRFVSIPFRNGQDRLAYATVIVDISERKTLEEHLAQARKLEAFGQLAAGIAHEINTPIQYIGDNTRFLQDAFGDITRLLSTIDRLLQESKGEAVEKSTTAEMKDAVFDADIEYLTEEIPVAIRQSLEGVDRVAGTVRAMKELSHPGGEEAVLTDINHVIENTLTISRNEWKYVADLVTDFDPDLPRIACLAGDVSQVVLNLIVNAAQAISEAAANDPRGKGTITVRTRSRGERVVIRVEDTGSGVPESLRDKIFEPFFTTKGIGMGTGQGLAIVRSIVSDRLDGTVTLETEVGRGAAFVISVPAKTIDPEKSNVDASAGIEYSPARAGTSGGAPMEGFPMVP